MTRLPALLVLAMLLAAAPPAQAQTRIYKWVDDDGVTHYTQQPPPEGEAVELDPETGTGSGRPAPPSADGGDGDDDGGGEDDARAAAGDGDTQSVEEYCAQLRERVETLAGDEPVRLRRDDDTIETLDAEARQARRTELEGQIAEHCTDG